MFRDQYSSDRQKLVIHMKEFDLAASQFQFYVHEAFASLTLTGSRGPASLDFYGLSQALAERGKALADDIAQLEERINGKPTP